MAASVPALNLDPTQMTFNEDELQNTNGMYGWSLVVSAPVTVTGVGWYDDGKDGLFHGHQIGIWSTLQSSGEVVLLDTVIIPVGTEAPLEGPYRKADFSVALTLEPGFLYTVAGTYEAAQEDVVKFARRNGPYDFSGDPRLGILWPALAFGGGFRHPDSGLLLYGVELGPMLFIEPIPEPSAAALLLTAGAVYWASRRRRGGSAIGCGPNR